MARDRMRGWWWACRAMTAGRTMPRERRVVHASSANTRRRGSDKRMNNCGAAEGGALVALLSFWKRLFHVSLACVTERPEPPGYAGPFA